ncbi:MarR family transcriptional regulator [Marinobacterium sp. D7]|uniref:MarR family winged helix-turn-helix transcriptional regulator n=1 Tax=Marinobacterium ramblicola TaxID=2849041 RepID=UPI001C2D1A59|nr:MarR family transcriptional regulator [Marinobacterium ramblicola]MBV1788045.1 MarR family transcriptional regulator [Marinobacterium ramblicola]
MPNSTVQGTARTRFGYRFVTLARRWRRFIDIRLAEAGLTDATWVPLMHLEESGDGISQKLLAERAGLDTSTLVRLIDILERKGLLERRTDLEDRRARKLYLTPSGRKQVGAIRKTLEAAEAEALGDLDDAQLEQMLSWIELIEGRLGEEIAKERGR